MSNSYSIRNALESADRYNLFVLWAKPGELSKAIEYLQGENVPVVNVGKELATFVENLEDDDFLHIEVYEYTLKLLEKSRLEREGLGNPVVAIYNIGILIEPRLELNAAKLLKDFSKANVMIILWEYPPLQLDRLHWPTQQNTIFIDFSDIHIKNLDYAI